jgi:DNA-binding MarR family transcriptional regulator
MPGPQPPLQTPLQTPLRAAKPPQRRWPATPERAAYTEAGAALFQLLRELEAAQPLLARLPVSHGRMAVLRTLALHGPRNLSQIARLRAVSRQGVQRLADALEAEGLVERTPDPHSRRAKRLALSEAGVRAYRELAQREARALNALAAGFSPSELHSATRVLRGLATRRRP